MSMNESKCTIADGYHSEQDMPRINRNTSNSHHGNERRSRTWHGAPIREAIARDLLGVAFKKSSAFLSQIPDQINSKGGRERQEDKDSDRMDSPDPPPPPSTRRSWRRTLRTGVKRARESPFSEEKRWKERN